MREQETSTDAAMIRTIDRDFAVPGVLDTILLGQPSAYVLSYTLEKFKINAGTIYQMWGLSHIHRKYILKSPLIDNEIKCNLIQEKYEEESVLARNKLYFSEIEWKYPIIHQMLLSDSIDIKALLHLIYESSDPETCSFALCIIMLETSTNRELEAPDAWDRVAWLGVNNDGSVPLRDHLYSDTIIAGMPHHVSSWLNFLCKSGGRDFVAEQIGDTWYSGFLWSDLTLEEMFIVGSKLNRYVHAVSESPFTPL